MDRKALAGLFAILGGLGFLFAVIVGVWFGWQSMKVYSAKKSGEARRLEAEQTKQILITQAQAEVEAAKLRAQAIEAIGEAAQKYPEYRHQEFIGAFAEALQEGNIDQMVYVPTEANIPIVEARPR